MIEIIPTVVPQKKEDIAANANIIRTFCDWMHVDIVDGVFAPTATWPYKSPGVFNSFDLDDASDLSVEAHLMVEELRLLGDACVKSGAKRILGHIEAFSDIASAREALDSWRTLGAIEVGLGLLMQTPIEEIAPLIAECDVVHLMSIARIGTQGIPFDAEAPARISEFHQRYPGVRISVDGGVAESNLKDLIAAGVTRFGIGSAIMKAPDPEVAYQRLNEVAEASLQDQNIRTS